MADLERIRTAGMESVNVTVGSALDIYWRGLYAIFVLRVAFLGKN